MADDDDEAFDAETDRIAWETMARQWDLEAGLDGRAITTKLVVISPRREPVAHVVAVEGLERVDASAAGLGAGREGDPTGEH